MCTVCHNCMNIMWNSHTYMHSQSHRKSTKLRFRTTSIWTKVPIKFGNSEIMYVELRAKKLWIILCTVCRNCMNMWNSHTYMHRTHLKNIASQQKLDLGLLGSGQRCWSNFQSSEMMCVELRAKKLFIVYRLL